MGDWDTGVRDDDGEHSISDKVVEGFGKDCGE